MILQKLVFKFFVVIASMILAIVMLAVGVWVFRDPLLNRFAKPKIENQIAHAVAGKASIQAIRFKSLVPIELAAQGLQIQSDQLTMSLSLRLLISHTDFWSGPPGFREVSQLIKTVNRLKTPALPEKSVAKANDRLGVWDFQLFLLQPRVQWTRRPNETQGQKKQADPQPLDWREEMKAFDQWPPFNIKLSVDNGDIYVYSGQQLEYSFENLQASYVAERVFQWQQPHQLDISLMAGLQSPIKFKTPISLKTKSLLVSPDKVSSTDLVLSLAGIDFSAQGETRLQTPYPSTWQAQVSIEDLRQLKAPPEILPSRHLRGSIHSKISLQGDLQSPVLQGDLIAKEVSGELDVQESGLLLRGPVRAATNIQFQWQPQNLTIKQGEFFVDLSAATVSYADLFSKPAEVSLSAEAKMSSAGSVSAGNVFAGNVFKMQQLSVHFAHLNIKAKGTYKIPVEIPAKTPGKTVDSPQISASIQLPASALDGLEKYFKPLSRSPLQGKIGFDGSIQGPVNQLDQLQVNVNQMDLRSVRGFVDYQNQQQGFLIKGPVQLDGQVRLKAKGENIQQANVNISADLSDLEFEKKDLFKKQQKETLRLKVIARQGALRQGATKKSQQIDAIAISQFELESSLLNLSASGNVSNFSQPRINVDIKTSVIDLKQLKSRIKAMRPLPLNGEASANIKLLGQYNFEQGYERSPLRVEGSLLYKEKRLQISMPNEKTDESSAAQVPLELPSKSLLPNWPVVRQSKLSLKVFLNEFLYQDILLKGLAVSSIYDKGLVKGKVEIQNMFSGQVRLDPLFVDLRLVELQPKVKASVSGIDLAQVLTVFMPEHKELAQGHVALTWDGKLSDPRFPGFLTRLQGQGQIRSQDLFLRSLPITSLVNEQLARIPGIGEGKRLKHETTLLQLQGDYQWQNDVIQWPYLFLQSDQKDALELKGQVVLAKQTGAKQQSAAQTMQLSLEGRALLANPPVKKGCLLTANLEKSGRFVVPLKLQGSITSPHLSVVSHAIEKIIANAAQCEKQKLLNKAKDKAKEKVKDEVEKKLKDTLKDIFK